MPSFDYIYDLIDKFKRDKFDFVITFLQEGQNNDQVHVFYEYSSPEAAKEVIEAMRLAIENIREEIGEGPGDDEDEDGDMI